ncbi:hypothetical protein MicvaDRAFT_0708 [Microcoleus vaginatus FGP-2]|nr:hypothetical protein MicvaDRAFT_0708 [Microcoleus vaginatus FGP-2]
MIESEISLPYVLLFDPPQPSRYFTDLALLYYRFPMLIITAIFAILQVCLIIPQNFNMCGRILPAGKGGEKCVSRAAYLRKY